jgi:hypothetical protein
MAWIAKTFGPRQIREAPVILPTHEFFPDEYDGSPRAGEAIFDRVCDYCNVPRSRVKLRWVHGRPDPQTGATFIKSDGTAAAGTYQAGDQQEIITISLANLREPMQLVATAAHELCHVHLLGDGRVDHDEPDHEPLTDLLTICLGMGIFGANACVIDKAWSNDRMSGWSVSSHGYLQQRTWGYALAVFAWVRGEERPAWAKHLRADVRATFKASAKYLDRHGVSDRALLE